MVSSLDLSSTRISSSTQSRGMPSTVRSSVRAAFHAGMTTITRPGGRSVTGRLQVDTAATSDRSLGSAAHERNGSECDAGGEDKHSGRGRNGPAAGLPTADGVVEARPARYDEAHP